MRIEKETVYVDSRVNTGKLNVGEIKLPKGCIGVLLVFSSKEYAVAWGAVETIEMTSEMITKNKRRK